MKFFTLYQYLAPLMLFPLSYYLWLRQFEANHAFVLLALSIPVLFAYLIPALGTNWLHLWEINTRLRLGKFRPQHGFVFGAATSLMALLCLGGMSTPFSPMELFRAGFVLGSVLAFWNWLYDMLAIQAGFIIVYNRPYAKNRGAEAIASAYAPVLFGSFGFCYGVTIRLSQYYLLELNRWDYYGWLLVMGNLAGLLLPVLAFVGYSYLKHGESGLQSYNVER
ncbi:MAG: hypothetical protein U0401_23895 [Anaerolineae bacterium]